MARRRHRSSKKKSRRKSKKSMFGGKRTLAPALREWIAHVKRVQKQHGVSYKDAMKLASKEKRI